MIKINTLLATAAVAGMLACNTAYAHDGDGHEGWHHGGCHHDGFLKLSDEKRKMLHEAMESVHKQNEPLFEQKHKLHEELHALLAAPKFDENAYLEKRAKMDELKATMHKNMETAFAQVAGKLTPEEREMLARMHHHHHGEWHHHGEEQQHNKS